MPVRKRNPILTREQETELARRWRNQGDVKAMHQLVESNTALAVKLSRSMCRRGVSLEDVIQEARVGLCIAAKHYDPERGIRFSTYAVHWMRAMIMEWILRNHGPVRIGTTLRQRRIFFGIGKALQGAQDKTDVDALAEKLQVSRTELENMLVRLGGRDVQVSANDVQDYERHDGVVLEHPGRSAEETLGELEEEHLHKAMVGAAWVNELDSRERAALGRGDKTLAVMGKKLGVSRERVRQIEVRAMRKVKDYIGL